MALIVELREEFLQGRADIDALDQELALERRDMILGAFWEGRELNSGEIERRKQIASTRAELAEALEALALTTIQELDDAEELSRLLAGIRDINNMLKDDLEYLVAIEKHAEKAAKVLEVLAQLIGKVAEVVV
tara:strand:- start:548 stop:946 length:399 start_codon:yes stop_codon:yes gene_type:complete